MASKKASNVAHIISPLRSPDWTQFGVRHEGEDQPGTRAVVVPGVSIKLVTTKDAWNARRIPSAHVTADVERAFKIGDVAVYHSYNTDYLGKIVSISEKRVVIEDHGRRRSLTLFGFYGHNYDFDLAKIQARNAAWMD